MNKSTLVKNMARHFPHLTLAQIDRATTVILDRVKASLVQNQRMEIRHFGSMATKCYPRHIAFHPKTGKALPAADYYRVHFKPAKALRELVDDN